MGGDQLQKELSKAVLPRSIAASGAFPESLFHIHHMLLPYIDSSYPPKLYLCTAAPVIPGPRFNSSILKGYLFNVLTLQFFPKHLSLSLSLNYTINDNVLSDQLCKSCWHRVNRWGHHIHHPIYTSLPMVCTKIIRTSNSCPLYPHSLLHK